KQLQVLQERMKALKEKEAKEALTTEEMALRAELSREIEEQEMIVENQRLERFLELAEKANKYEITTVEGQEILRMRQLISRLYAAAERLRSLDKQANLRKLTQQEAEELAELQKHRAYVRMAEYVDQSITALLEESDKSKE